VKSGRIFWLHMSAFEQQMMFLPWICADFPALH
jgi:hypothetical protein